jgi:mannose/fructose-specific phosphotransferase system component IIA
VINIVVITHGEFGSYIVEAAEGIVGVQSEGVVSLPISPRLTIDEVRARLTSTLEDLSKGEGVVVVTDIPGGTPSNISIPAARGKKNIRVLSGVNLYMLVTAFNHRSDMNLDELVQVMLESAKKSVVDVQKLLAARS